jgi:hypothetical protein
MTLSSELGIEAALYNEHTLAWEPFIEPTLDKNGTHLSPWNIIFSITRVSFTNRSFKGTFRELFIEKI